MSLFGTHHAYGYPGAFDANVRDREVLHDAGVRDITSPAPVSDGLVPLAMLKRHLEIDDRCEGDVAYDDARLSALLEAAVQWTENYLSRALRCRQIEYVLDDFPARRLDRIYLSAPPVKCVHEIRYRCGRDDAVMPSDEYRFEPATDSLCPVYGCYWPCIPRYHGAVRIRYDAGYDVLPPQILQAVLMMAGHFNENREATAPVMINTVPLGVVPMLAAYRAPLVL